MTANSVYQAFAATARRNPDRPFLQLVSDTARRYGSEPRIWTYAQALRCVDALIDTLRLRLPAPGTRIALALDNRPAFFFWWLAANAIGRSVVPLNREWRSGELEYVLEHSDTGLIIALAERAGSLTGVASILGLPLLIDEDVDFSKATAQRQMTGIDGLTDPAPRSLECALLYTSGTTGRPKGCMLSNEYFLSSGEWYMNLGGYCELKPGADRLITPLPMYHMNAMAVSTMAMILTGGCIVPLDRFHPASWWASVRECDATIIHYLGVMPVMLMGMSPDPQDAEHNIRFGFGAGLAGELHRAFEKRFGFRLIEAWAMTETGCSVAIMAQHEPRKVGTACFGRPPAHVDWRLIDDTGADVAVDQPGELLVRYRGENVRYGFFSGYLKDPAATREVWADDYFHTGDLVRIDNDGLMHFVDRKKNVIRRSGENISAVEVEQVLMEVRGVRALAVTAVPDAVRGDEVCACVVPSEPDVSTDGFERQRLAEQMIDHCLDRLAYYKAPGYVLFLEALPLTPTEKIQRGELKALAAASVDRGDCLDLRNRKVRRG